MRAPGVISTRVGFMGGELRDPSYEEVVHGHSGHFEVVEVVYDTEKVTFRELAQLFFEIHDSTQENGQGPDLGPQYLSMIFTTNDAQRIVALELIEILKTKGIMAVTQVEEADTFWPAEEYHQKYYEKNGQSPYCHVWKKIF